MREKLLREEVDLLRGERGDGDYRADAKSSSPFKAPQSKSAYNDDNYNRVGGSARAAHAAAVAAQADESDEDDEFDDDEDITDDSDEDLDDDDDDSDDNF